MSKQALLGTWQASALQLACAIKNGLFVAIASARECVLRESSCKSEKTILARVQVTLKPTKETREDYNLQPGRPSEETYLLTYLPTNLLSQTKCGKSAN